MINIAGNKMDLETILKEFPSGEADKKIVTIMASSNTVYSYSTINELKFEITMRKKIIEASIKLNDSRFSFKVFKKSKCNTHFWKRTDEGGFKINEGVQPFDAINDIFENSSKYGTECATAIVIVICKALIDIFPPAQSNKLLEGIYLMNWSHLNNSLGIDYYRNPSDFFPGDCRYFKNPDVDPEKPEWQGENTIDLGNDTYYGHGIGITSAKVIIRELNKQRIPDSKTTAFLLDAATRPDFKHLADIYSKAH